LHRLPIVAALALLLGGCALFVERPDYTVVERFEAFELRRYPPMVVAETVVDSRFEEAGNRAFGRLAGYIGGENRAREDISMTAPVNQRPVSEEIDMTAPVVQREDEAGGERYVIGFVMPAQYTLETLPEPTDERVRLRRVEGRLIAALRYSGTWTEKRYREREQRLLRAVRGAGLEVEGEPVFARYNPPLTPWFLRRNEIQVPVRRP
jgi:hypothetical protein